jgi:hypothetical protein
MGANAKGTRDKNGEITVDLWSEGPAVKGSKKTRTLEKRKATDESKADEDRNAPKKRAKKDEATDGNVVEQVHIKDVPQSNHDADKE